MRRDDGLSGMSLKVGVAAHSCVPHGALIHDVGVLTGEDMRAGAGVMESLRGAQEARRKITKRIQKAFFNILRLYNRGNRAIDDERELGNEKDQRWTVNARGHKAVCQCAG